MAGVAHDQTEKVAVAPFVSSHIQHALDIHPREELPKMFCPLPVVEAPAGNEFVSGEAGDLGQGADDHALHRGTPLRQSVFPHGAAVQWTRCQSGKFVYSRRIGPKELGPPATLNLRGARPARKIGRPDECLLGAFVLWAAGRVNRIAAFCISDSLLRCNKIAAQEPGTR